MAPTPVGSPVRVRPKLSLLSNALAAVLLGTTPIFVVSYWFASTRGGVQIVVISHVIVITVGLFLVWRQLAVFCAVTETELVGNGIFTRTVRARIDRVARVLLVPTYRGAAPDPQVQLLVLDAHGKRLFRMRGAYWHESDLLKMAAAIPVPTERVTEAMTMPDFFRAYPEAAFWFERRWLLRMSLGILAALLVMGVAAWLMYMLGLPVRILP